MPGVGGSAIHGWSMPEELHWLGHDTFKIVGDKIIYTDPFRLKSNDAADIILITHEHYDHCSPDDVNKLLRPETVIIAPSDCATKLSWHVKVVKPGDKLSIYGITVEVVPAYNTNKPFHTKDRGWVGYIFTVNDRKIYLAGDTDFIPEMKTFEDIDVALLPVSGTYVMTAEEAAEAALAIKPKAAVPMHYGTIVGSKKDADIFAAKLHGKVQVIIPEQESTAFD